MEADFANFGPDLRSKKEGEGKNPTKRIFRAPGWYRHCRNIIWTPNPNQTSEHALSNRLDFYQTRPTK